MPCFTPLQAWRGPVNVNGKVPLVFKKPGGLAVEEHPPCGQCLGCRLDYSLDWATRCLCESQMHRRNCFITFTYSPEFLPKDGALDHRHVQLFFKRMRKELGPFRFFMAGEYGDQYGRPHYHALLFGCDFADRVYLSTTPAGERIYRSHTLSRLWGMGYCSVGELTFESAAYVARYCMKKVTKERRGELTPEFIEKYVDKSTGVMRQPDYVRMSRGGRNGRGLAYEWFQKYQSDVYPSDFLIVRGGVKMPPPRYFDKLYSEKFPLDMQRIKLHRIARCTKYEEVWIDALQKFKLLPADSGDRLHVREQFKAAQIRLLSRTLEGSI